MSDIVYLYGYAPAGTGVGGVPAGIDAHPVEPVAAGGVLALISRLPAHAYAAGVLERRLEDLDWVAQRGLAHERVVAWFVDHAEIVPAPLFTLFSSVDALRADAERRSDEIRALLARFAGLREWDVKLAYRADTLAASAAVVSDAVRALDGEIAAAAPGRRFLLERKRAGLLKSEVAQAAHRIANEVFDELRAGARDAVRLDLPQTATALPVVLSAALLAPRDEQARVLERLRARADALRPLGMELEFSGPWAPYRFLGGRRER